MNTPEIERTRTIETAKFLESGGVLRVGVNGEYALDATYSDHLYQCVHDSRLLTGAKWLAENRVFSGCRIAIKCLSYLDEKGRTRHYNQIIAGMFGRMCYHSNGDGVLDIVCDERGEIQILLKDVLAVLTH